VNFLKNLRIKQMTILATLVSCIGASYACDSNKSSDKTPAPAGGKTCSSTATGGNLALQSGSSNTLYIGYDKASENGKDVTSTYSIKAIMNKYCVSCHKSGGKAADTPMTTYSQVKALADNIIRSVEEGEMPMGNISAGKTILPYLKAWKASGATQAQPTKSAANSSTTNTKTNTKTNSSSGSGSSSSKSNKSTDDDKSSDGTLNSSSSNTNTKC
jgi:mono/diheme cytochrome c family protein